MTLNHTERSCAKSPAGRSLPPLALDGEVPISLRSTMLPKLIDHSVVRIALAVVGFLLSTIALFATPHGIILGYAGIVKQDALLIFIGLMTILGVIAIVGAWYRLLVPHVEMNRVQARRIRFCSYCGVASSLGLAGWAAYEAEFYLVVALGLFAFVGIALIKGTPIPNAL